MSVCRHVVLDALMVRPRPTGVGRAALELIAALATVGSDLTFTVLATHPEMFPMLRGQPGWRLLACPGARGGTLGKAIYIQAVLPRLLRQLQADLLHTLHFVGPVHAPCPLVVTLHDLGFRHFPGTVEPLRRLYYRLLVPATLRRAVAVACSTRATADDLGEFFPAVTPRAVVTHLGTPSWVWDRPGAGERNEGELAEDDRPFLFVGTLEPRKNLTGLLEAYVRYRSALAATPAATRPRQLVLVGGKGWNDREITRRLKELHERGWVELTDYCSAAELWDRYRTACALLFPSLHEGFGLPILEAMAAGLPVLTSARGATAEVAGEAAFLVDPEDSAALAAGLMRLHDDADLRRDLANRGLARARSWSWTRTARATLDIYQRVLAEGSAAK